MSPAVAGGFFTSEPLGKPWKSILEDSTINPSELVCKVKPTCGGCLKEPGAFR